MRHSSSHSNCDCGCGCCFRVRDKSIVRTDNACTSDWAKSASSFSSLDSFDFTLQTISFTKRPHEHRTLIISRHVVNGHDSCP